MEGGFGGRDPDRFSSWHGIRESHGVGMASGRAKRGTGAGISDVFRANVYWPLGPADVSAANKLIIHIGLPKAASTSWQTTVLMKLQHPNVIYGGRLPPSISA